MDTKYLLQKLRDHDLHYSEQERAAQVLADLMDRLIRTERAVSTAAMAAADAVREFRRVDGQG